MADEDFQKESPTPKPRRERLPRPPLDDDDDDRIRRPGAVESIIPYKNPKALIAYYCGVFAVIPCVGLLLGPTALILGILGIRYRNKHPTAGGMGHAITGVVLGSLTTAANWGIALLALFGAILSGMK